MSTADEHEQEAERLLHYAEHTPTGHTPDTFAVLARAQAHASLAAAKRLDPRSSPMSARRDPGGWGDDPTPPTAGEVPEELRGRLEAIRSEAKAIWEETHRVEVTADVIVTRHTAHGRHMVATEIADLLAALTPEATGEPT